MNVASNLRVALRVATGARDTEATPHGEKVRRGAKTMKIQRLLIALTVVNLGLLIFLLLSHVGPTLANGVAPVVRGRALEIVDDQGRVRASIKVQPAETFKPTGKKYAETVILRLIDPDGRPEVKIAASEQGAGLSFVGDSDATQVVLEADGTDSSLKLTNKDGKQQLVKP
jgi:hypothetical protein